MARDVGVGIAIFVDEMQDVTEPDVSALCAACHELSQQGLPLVVVGAACRTCRPCCRRRSPTRSGCSATYASTGSTVPRLTGRWSTRPPRRGLRSRREALEALYVATDGYPYFVQAYGKVTWDHAPRSPVTRGRRLGRLPRGGAELAVGFFGSRYERATPAERDYLRAMAALSEPRTGRSSTAEVANHLGRKPSSLSPARDSLIKKGLVYSAERGTIAFTVPHFDEYLRKHG